MYVTEQAPAVEARIFEARKSANSLGALLDYYRPFLVMLSEQAIGPKLAAVHDASDLAQETIAKAFEKFSTFRGATTKEFLAWLKAIHRNHIADKIRRPDLPLVTDGDGDAGLSWFEPAADQSSVSKRIIRDEVAAKLARLMEALPERQRQAVRMRHFEAMSTDAIAEAMGSSTTAVAGLIRRGLRHLRGKTHESSWF